MNLPKTKKELYDTYYLKNELVKLCKNYGLPTTGLKENLLEYICGFIEKKTVKKIIGKQKKVNSNFEPSLKKIIDINYSNNEIHRAFFKETIGKYFKFNVQFMNWMEENKGKNTYNEAIKIYNKIAFEKKSGKKNIIRKQFEYNHYTRDFFEDNPNLSKNDCIKCWNYKKKQIGKHKYEKEDIKILEM
ncbi:MAG: SAP domain-containing protein [Treponema sp.]|nr:SAP domain-containing protein [Treponema sp.]